MPDTVPQFSLSVGDRVVYPNQGVCRVAAVEDKEVAGQTLTFVTMRREEDGAVVMVPQAKVHSIGLRRVASTQDVNKVFAFLKSDSDRANLDWKQRARTNLDRMSSGGIIGLAEVVKGLQVLSELRPLPTKERELYDNARHLLVSEISASLGITDCDAEDAIDLLLFPPGRERPKRTAEEFKRPAADGEEEPLELGDALISLGGDLELPLDTEEVGESEKEEDEDASEEVSEEPAEKPKRRGASKRAARPTKAATSKNHGKTKARASKASKPSKPAARSRAKVVAKKKK
jgi:CarD family transcriptional regulator